MQSEVATFLWNHSPSTQTFKGLGKTQLQHPKTILFLTNPITSIIYTCVDYLHMTTQLTRNLQSSIHRFKKKNLPGKINLRSRLLAIHRIELVHFPNCSHHQKGEDTVITEGFTHHYYQTYNTPALKLQNSLGYSDFSNSDILMVIHFTIAMSITEF